MADKADYQVGGEWGLGDGYKLGSEYGYGDIGNSTTPDQLVYKGSFGRDVASDIGNSARSDVGSQYSSSAGLMANQNGAGGNGLVVPNIMSSADQINGGGSTAGAVGNGIGAVAGSYNNASTDTTGSVMSGVASGAAAGAAFGPWGMVIGGVIGGISGYFGSKSKKKAAKKAFQEQEELAVAPQRQAQANWLQQQGLLQKAIGNYKSGYTPGGYQYSNGLLGNAKNSGFGNPTGPANLPNFNVDPPNVSGGNGDPSLGIQGHSTPSSGLTPGGLVAPQTTIQQPAPINATPPDYTKDKAQQQQGISDYQKNYAAMIQQQNQQSAAAAMDPYKNFYMGNS